MRDLIITLRNLETMNCINHLELEENTIQGIYTTKTHDIKFYISYKKDKNELEHLFISLKYRDDIKYIDLEISKSFFNNKEELKPIRIYVQEINNFNKLINHYIRNLNY